MKIKIVKHEEPVAKKEIDFGKIRALVIHILRNLLGFLIFPAITFYLTERYTHSIFEKMNTNMILFNLLFYWMFAALLLGLFGRLSRALQTETLFFGLLGLTNFYVYRFRSVPILPWDIFSLKTATSVADNYDYALKKETIFVIAAFILLMVLEYFVCDLVITSDIRRCMSRSDQKALSRLLPDPSRKETAGRFFSESADTLQIKKEYPKPVDRPWPAVIRLVLLICCCTGICAYTHALHQDAFISKMKIYDKLFTPDTMQYKDGSVVAFLMELKYITVQKPEGYSAAGAEEMLEAQNVVDTASLSRKPNIIIVMNEAFSDPAVLCDFDASEDYMPFVHTLQDTESDRWITGTLDVSVLGGNTANSEFELLTGDTMAFFTDGSVPYQQYIRQEMPSLPSYLQSLGYRTVAMHPYKPTGWNRDVVYPLLGFEESLFKSDFQKKKLVRTYISDESCVDQIISTYENKGDDPLFVFNVTMQNHGGYTKEAENFTPDIKVEGVDNFACLSYLSLMKLSDKAFERLCDYFADQDEDTIIIMFGDHQPSDSVVNPLLKLSGKSCSKMTEEETLVRYQVPLVIWANFDLEKDDADPEMSLNYLGGYVLEKAGLPLSRYQTYLAKLQKEIPVISSKKILLSNGTLYNEDAIRYDLKEELLPYRRLQYYSLFDWNSVKIQ